MSWVLAFAGFAALIILHEAGHFAAAKAVGMRVERFMLFFPPILAKVRRGETEYGIGAVPLGGYVKITGMTPHEELTPEVAPRAYLNMPVWKRVVVIAAGPFVNVVIAFLIIWALFAGQRDRARRRSTVDSVAQGSPAAAALQPGDRSLVGRRHAGLRGRAQRRGGRPPPAGAAQAGRRAHVRGHAGEGCRATTPAHRRRRARRRAGVTERITPRYDRRTAEAARCCSGFAYGTRSEDVGPGARRGRDGQRHVATSRG